MRQVDLLVLLDREAQALTDENNHSAAVLMREAAKVIRELQANSVTDFDVRLARADRKFIEDLGKTLGI